MMAKFQQKEDPAKNLDEEAKIEGVVPPVNLPSLRSLTNQGPLFGEELEPVAEEKAEVAKEEVPDFSRMGASMSSEEEFQAIAFLKSVAEELKNIEWPPADRVFKITVIILVSIVVASAGIYVVDGFFYSIAQILFETNV